MDQYCMSTLSVKIVSILHSSLSDMSKVSDYAFEIFCN